MATTRFQLWLLLGMLVSSSTQASLIERTILVKLADSHITTTNDVYGNPGKSLIYSTSLEPFSIEIGDTIITHVEYDQYLAISDIGNGFQSSPTEPPSSESLVALYWYDVPGYAATFVSSTTTLNIVSGSSYLSTFTNVYESYGNGVYIQAQTVDLTDSTILLRGMDIETTVLDRIGSMQYSTSEFLMTMQAGDLSIAQSVPEPRSVALFGLCLGVLAITRRYNRKPDPRPKQLRS